MRVLDVSLRLSRRSTGQDMLNNSEKFNDNGQCDSDVYHESVHAVNERYSQLLHTVPESHGIHSHKLLEDVSLLVWTSAIQVKWNCKLSEPINVLRGTRQGGLSSPLLFNML